MTAHVLAFAKLNLSLSVLRQRQDGFHEIDSIVQTIDLADRIEIDVARGRGVAVENTLIGIQGPDLVERAAAALLAAKATTCRVAIRIAKGIPAGAGLGGGSSDAAAVLRTLDRLTPPRLPAADLAALAAQIGSDVALFLDGGRARISGRGDIVMRLPASPHERFAVIVPAVRCPTAEIYGAWAAHHVESSVTEPSPGRNDLLAPALHVRPELRRYDEAVTSCGGQYAGMSGSGSSFYVAFDDPAIAARCAGRLRKTLPECAVYDCGGTDVGSLWQEEENA